jgi:cellulose synthase (UDP-forming)
MVLSRKKKLLYILAIVLSSVYLLWRVFFTIPWQENLAVIIFAVLLVGSELFSNFTAFVLIVFRLLESKKTQELVVPTFTEQTEIPAIDVLIVTHNEDVELLRKTVNAATFMDYPDKSKVHIVFSDDGNREAVRALAAEYGVDYVGLSGNKEAKSGNINHTLSQCHAPLFAIFDADMIPFSSFLLASVPFFTENQAQRAQDDGKTPPLGFVQTPQSFYNADIFQFNLFSEKIVANEQDFFSRDINVLNGYNNTALFTGSNAVFLRAAVDEVGGFPTDTLTEDFELGTMINMAGYTSIATKTSQSSGTTPIDVKGVIKQRTRWARGVIQSCRNVHIFINPKLTFLNRIILINTYLYWWSFSRRIIYIAAPLLYALFKIQVVQANFWLLMLVWAPGYFLLHYVLGDGTSKIRNERWGEIQETFFAPYLFIPVLLETIGIKAKKFKVTEKNVHFSFKDKLYGLPYLFMWSATFIAIVKFNYGKWGSEIIVGSVITFWLLMHFINLSFCLFIALGRDVHRTSERFKRTVSGTISCNHQAEPVAIETCDLSEGGLAFKFTAGNQRLIGGDFVSGTLQHADTMVHFSGVIQRVIRGEAPRYGVLLDEMTSADFNHYLQLIYDGHNEFLPTEQDTWITPLDELQFNVVYRLKQLERLLKRRTHHMQN